MKVYQFQQRAYTASNHNLDLLVGLRHRKIIINNLLRWCSAGLASSYILTIITGIYFYNQLTLISMWEPDLVLVLFALLLMWLFYVQYQYSEKKTESRPFYDDRIKMKPINNYYLNKQRLTNIYMIISFATWLIMIGIFFWNRQMTKGVFIIFGLILYSFGLFMIRDLLREKCFIRQMIRKLGPF
jgi:hypothetical protein